MLLEQQPRLFRRVYVAPSCWNTATPCRRRNATTAFVSRNWMQPPEFMRFGHISNGVFVFPTIPPHTMNDLGNFSFAMEMLSPS